MIKLSDIIQGYLKESHNPREVYHGTNSIMADKILSQGYDLTKSGLKTGDANALPGISTTIEYDIAQEHAEWAASRFGGKPVVLKASTTNLKLMPGSEFFAELDKLNSAKLVLDRAKSKYDGVIMFDYDSEEGLEEFEINIFQQLKWVLV
jgi:hypothetical protein